MLSFNWKLSVSWTCIMYQYLVFICVILATASAQEDPCYREGTNCYKSHYYCFQFFLYSMMSFSSGLGNEIGHTPYFPDIWACELACRYKEAVTYVSNILKLNISQRHPRLLLVHLLWEHWLLHVLPPQILWLSLHVSEVMDMASKHLELNAKSRDDHAISGMIDECTEDTTPTRWLKIHLPFLRNHYQDSNLGLRQVWVKRKTNDIGFQQ